MPVYIGDKTLPYTYWPIWPLNFDLELRGNIKSTVKSVGFKNAKVWIHASKLYNLLLGAYFWKKKASNYTKKKSGNNRAIMNKSMILWVSVTCHTLPAVHLFVFSLFWFLLISQQKQYCLNRNFQRLSFMSISLNLDIIHLPV